MKKLIMFLFLVGCAEAHAQPRPDSGPVPDANDGYVCNLPSDLEGRELMIHQVCCNFCPTLEYCYSNVCMPQLIDEIEAPPECQHLVDAHLAAKIPWAADRGNEMLFMRSQEAFQALRACRGW
jgi:hypothetical protein